jgi:DNA-directed DNA polymerase III PolC
MFTAHSYYSLRYGTLAVQELIELAKQKGIRQLALTDINNSTGVLEFVKHCRQEGIAPVAGMDFFERDKHYYTAIARNNDGFDEINRLRSHHNLTETPLPYFAPPFNNAFTIYPLGAKQKHELLDNEYIGVRPDEVGKLYSTEFRTDHSRLVAYNPVTFKDSVGYFLHQNLRAIDKNTVFGKLAPHDFARQSETMLTFDQIKHIYRDNLQILKNSERLASECSFEFDFKEVKNKKTFTGDTKGDLQLLRKLATEGLNYRYGSTNSFALERMEKELGIIEKMNFAAYFLITWDIVQYSMSKGIYHVGRGSGANSLVAYCLKISDVDPIELDLYFERFLNPKRTSPPDFDIDYSWKDREQVQQYIFAKYRREHTALLGTVSTFKDKSIYRELGKVYGLPKEEIDSFIEKPDVAFNQNEITRKIIKIGGLLEDFPNIRSIHAGGILISELPITYYSALDLPPKGFPTTQWDMYTAADIGFEKLDILSQRGIGHIFEALEIIKKNKAINLDIHQVEKFKTDPNAISLLERGETNGCFYIESPGMRGLLTKLRCNSYISLVAASSIIRPGVAQSGMMREYIKRFHHPKSFKYLHPIFEQQLGETFGVMVYQEDVLKICHHFAGLELDEADVLRRIMSGKPKFRNELETIINKFYANCRQRGYPEELTNEVWRQIKSFAGYSFSKAHSASYAVESFQSLYLKTYFPREFMVAVINNFGGFFQTWVYFNEAKRWGAHIKLPCVNHSDLKTNIIGEDVFVGFVHIARLEHLVAQEIVAERQKNGHFADLLDFTERVRIGMEQIIILIRIGSFRFTGKTKAALLWDAHQILKKSKPQPEMRPLFRVEKPKFELPDLKQNDIEDAYDEIELLSFPVSCTMFDLLKTKYRGECIANQLKLRVGTTVRMVGQLVTIKYVWTKKKEIMNFGTFLDCTGEFFDTTNFPPSLKNWPFQGYGIYLIQGKVVEEFGFPSIEVEKMAKLPIVPDPRS